MDYTQIILWSLVMGFATALVAQSKGFRARTWFALGFLLGPFALLIITIQKKKTAEPENETDSISN